MCRKLIPLLLLFGACRGSPAGSARSAAEAFLDRYYVELSPEAALPFTTGPAEAAVRETIRLRDESGRTGAQASQVRPHVYWSRLGEPAVKDGDTVLRYGLQIDSGGEAMNREVTVVTRSGEGGWKVVGFLDREGKP